MLPPESYQLAEQNADAHLQLVIEDVATSEVPSGLPVATVSGPIVRVFRGEAALLGQRVSLQLHYYIPGQTHVRPGPVGVRPLTEIRAGRVVEALVTTRGGAMQIPLGLCMLLDNPTDQPCYVLAPPLEEAKRSWGWLPFAAFALLCTVASYFLWLR